ncbi:PREDICTED: secretory carrier-associated membrane protein 1-like [Acropora digitifera]|uniref:secretory carrier-associated membrane protein 1-like n=1 Tax=Acropora digitifera TaxID=70779 RepID=UPI00077A23AC|nr:PREDICTED: secretory carrier-associated membrane protein 1-like [Acropora digitifera]
MAKYDDNPFAGDSENPFADPFVASHTSNAARGIEDFNPFVDQNSSKPGSAAKLETTPIAPPPILPDAAGAPPRSQPAVLQAKEEPPPYKVEEEHENLRKRQEDLERKAAELQRKEQELQRMQFGGYRENNFPPLPSKCPCKPCFFQDISIDIPIEYQKTSRALFIRWEVYVFTLCYNCIAAMALLVSKTGLFTKYSVSLSRDVLLVAEVFKVKLFLSSLFVFSRNDSSFSYVVFFLIYFLHIGFNITYFLGIAGWGACGFINATDVVGHNLVVGIMMYVAAALFAVGVIIDIALLIKMHRIYRSAGASLEKAQGEFAKGVVTNPHVQNAAGEAAAAGVRNAMTGSNTK